MYFQKSARNLSKMNFENWNQHNITMCNKVYFSLLISNISGIQVINYCYNKVTNGEKKKTFKDSIFCELIGRNGQKEEADFFSSGDEEFNRLITLLKICK